MGTNYFAVDKERVKRHIGKMSFGWEFVFHGYEEEDFKIKAFDEWEVYLKRIDVEIYDGCDESIATDTFLKLVKDSIGKRRHSIGSDRAGWYDTIGFAFLNHYFS
ncbi:MAG: hypothetical protein HYX61_09560 [Gammaproteobacteria bacterium]|nr:hypothetical protein [Gammaproteobacteria bacterium]